MRDQVIVSVLAVCELPYSDTQKGSLLSRASFAVFFRSMSEL
jgi:hypothetical protein